MSTRSLCLWIVLIGIGAPIQAQEVIRRDDNVEADSPEGWAMFYTTSVTLPGGLGTPQHREPGALEFGVEVGSIPSLSKQERTVGFNGTKEEDLNKSPVFARPSLSIGLPGDFSLVLAYVPPLEVYGVKPNLFTVMLERPLLRYAAWSAGARLYAQTGTVQGAFTCSNNVAKKTPGSVQNPYGCDEKSSDEATQRYAGVELSGAYRIEALRDLSPYMAVSANYLDTKVHVDGTTFGVRDRTRLYADGWTYGFSAGVSYPIDDRLDFSAGMFYSPLEVRRADATSNDNDALLNYRAIVRYRFR